MTFRKETRYKVYIALGLSIFLALLALFVFSGDNFTIIKNVFTKDLSNEQLSETLKGFGWRGYITVVILATLQVVCAFLPAEPTQVLAGLTFGFPVGLLCCCIGVFLGNTFIYLLHKTFGDKISRFFIKKLHLDLEKVARSSKCVLIIFILYFLPVIPYGMICFFAASIGMKYRKFITVTMLGSLPSVCIGVALGYMTISSNWIVSVCVFAVLLILLAFMLSNRNKLFSKINAFADKHKDSSKNSVQKVNGFALSVIYYCLRLYYFICGVKIVAKNNVGVPEKPSIVLCTHGSFIDFIFVGALLKKFKPNFIIARLYFYDKRLRWLLKTIGGFPKSMFAVDVESTKNCLKVLKSGGILAMMPEARLSTTGRFEDIQENTYSFIKKAGVSVYTVNFYGDYFADPKWGKGFRRGSIVEAEFNPLYSAEDINNMTPGQIKQGVEERLYYNEFEWLKGRPHIHYRSKRMAEGIENILTTCPHCKSKHIITAKSDKIYCEKCGYLTSLTDRYEFDNDFIFKNLTEWYDWQKEILKGEILNNKDYSLVSPVKLRLPSNGKGLTRSSGEGVCTLNRQGLTYIGTKDGKEVKMEFSIERIYRLLFGAGENFEIYNGTEILYFVPEEKRSAVEWYMASMIIYDDGANL